MTIDDIIDQYCTIGTHSLGGKIHIKHVMDHPLRTVLFTIEKMEVSMASHQTAMSHMLYSLECMDPTVSN